jgi:phage terminase Nu1 subunit (DNA packaging protein)
MLSENAAKAQANLAELKAAQARGSLLDAEAVEREWSDVLGAVRAGMLAVPSREGTRLLHLTGHDL